MSAIAVAKKVLACGLFTCDPKEIKPTSKPQQHQNLKNPTRY
jgi:hypothetical protein